MSRFRSKTAMIILSAAAIGGVTLATPAHAAQLGQASVYRDTRDEARDWNAGWNACRAKFPSTKSIKVYGVFAAGDRGWEGIWNCYSGANND